MPEPRTVLLADWHYTDSAGSQETARAFFAVVRSALEHPKPGTPFPFEGAFEIALVNAGPRYAPKNECWMIVALVPVEGDSDFLVKIRPWLRSFGAEWGGVFTDLEDAPADASLERLNDERGWGTIIDSFTGTSLPKA
jgi:hypothetical protein